MARDPSPRRWTARDLSRLRASLDRSEPYGVIAERLGRSESAVANKLFVLRRTDGEFLRRSQRWTGEEERTLLMAIDAGEDLGVVASRHGRSLRAVTDRLALLRPDPLRQAPRPWTLARDGRLVELYETGTPLRVIADELGESIPRIHRRAEELRGRGQIALVRRIPWTPERRAQLAKRYREGTTLKELGIEFELTKGSITAQLARLRRSGVDFERLGLSLPIAGPAGTG